MSSSPLWVQILTIIILTLINALFAAAELAFLSVNEQEINQLAEDGDKRAIRVKELIKESDEFLSTIQVVVTLAGLLSSAAAATNFAHVLASWLPPFTGVETVATVIVTLLLSYVVLVFGELFPKVVALQMPEKIALATSGLIKFVQIIFKPLIRVLSWSTMLLQKITPIDFTETQPSYTREAMRVILAESREEGSIDLEELTMLEGVLSLDNKMAREVMTPRVDAEMIDLDDEKKEIFFTLLDSPFSRLPLYQEDRDNVIGTIHLKNVFKAFHDAGYDYDKVDFLAIANEPLVVPSTIYIDDLLVAFQQEQTHMAILKDEYGGVEGIITMEDVLEEIVGDIDDEYDTALEREITQVGPETYDISGGLMVDKFNHFFDEEIQVEEVDTMGGLFLYIMNYVPEDTEKISLRVNELILTTTQIENGRIRTIRVNHDTTGQVFADYYVNLTDPEESLSRDEFEKEQEEELENPPTKK